MNKLNVYLTKKANKQKEAFQKVKTQISAWDYSPFIVSPNSSAIKNKE